MSGRVCGTCGGEMESSSEQLYCSDQCSRVEQVEGGLVSACFPPHPLPVRTPHCSPPHLMWVEEGGWSIEYTGKCFGSWGEPECLTYCVAGWESRESFGSLAPGSYWVAVESTDSFYVPGRPSETELRLVLLPPEGSPGGG